MAVAKKKAPEKKRVVLKRAAKKKAASKKRPAKKILKKTAPKKVTKKKVSKPRKKTTRSKKKTTTKKKVAAKSKKKVAKKKISSKKTTRKRLVKRTKQLKVTTNDKDVSTKIHIVDRSHSTDASAKGRFFKSSELRLTKPSIVQIISNQNVLKNVASYSGVAFVAIGGFFSLLHMQAIVEPFPITNSTDSIEQVANVIEGDATNGVTAPDKTPEPRIAVGSDNYLKDMARITVTVPYAEEVFVLAKSMENRQLFNLGRAHAIDDSTWKFDWDTKQFEDNEYSLKVVIKNIYGSYDFTDSKTYEVKNEPFSEPEEASDPESETNDSEENGLSLTESTENQDEADSSEEESSEDPLLNEEEDSVEEDIDEQEETEVRLQVEDGYISERLLLEVSVLNAEKVKLYAKNKQTRNLHFIGYAIQKTSTEWYLRWNTESVVNGEYDLYASAVVVGELVSSDISEVSVENEMDTKEDEEIKELSIKLDTGQTNLLEPDIRMDISSDSPVSGFVNATVYTPSAEWVELYAVRQNSLILKFLGLAKGHSFDTWKYVWDTTNVPNGEYSLYARIKTEYGFLEGERMLVEVANDISIKYSDKEEDHIDSLIVAEESLIKITDTVDVPEDSETDDVVVLDAPKIAYVGSVESFLETVDMEEEDQERMTNTLKSYRSDLNELLDDLARATRSEDDLKVEEVQKQMNELKKQILFELASDPEKTKVADKVNKYVSQVTSELEEITIRNENILKERAGDKLTKDSDNDSISDYDEINLYKTNPYVADSDGDGFIDSAEIERGYNPNDSRSEALVAYESPKEAGIVREELFKVESITTLSDETETSENVPKKALITGKGLPNSFVTIYIFSTPVIVTVRTDSDGSWRYVFDKELEDGEHEIYVGVTDNAGKIVGKSAPVSFVKTAEAYSTEPEEEGAFVSPEVAGGSLVANKTLLLIGSLAIVSLGLVLILLGFHVTSRREDSIVASI